VQCGKRRYEPHRVAAAILAAKPARRRNKRRQILGRAKWPIVISRKAALRSEKERIDTAAMESGASQRRPKCFSMRRYADQVRQACTATPMAMLPITIPPKRSMISSTDTCSIEDEVAA
jgi:hypothetical protein